MSGGTEEGRLDLVRVNQRMLMLCTDNWFGGRVIVKVALDIIEGLLRVARLLALSMGALCKLAQL